MKKDIIKNSKILWDYLCLRQELQEVDALLVFGGHDPSVAQHAADLFKQGYAKKIIISGGNIHPAKFYGNEIDLIEAEAICEVVLRAGIPREAIILEKNARNTSENFWFTADLIEKEGLNYNSFILVQKPYTERRTYLTGLNRWSDKNILISSIKITFDDYLETGIDTEKIINMMTGEIYRLEKYPDLGYFKRVEIPETVMKAFDYLVKEGYNKRFEKQII
jgi:uncharacterized SAM-binding protein YcdF (DUF218 family)